MKRERTNRENKASFNSSSSSSFSCSALCGVNVAYTREKKKKRKTQNHTIFNELKNNATFKQPSNDVDPKWNEKSKIAYL